MSPVYRKDIDGLRAIAVLAVVLNHAKIPGFSGGYVGVDIFFVISGFLITGIILREIAENKFTFSGFYERRIRRIIPALLGVVLFVIAGSFILFDAQKIQMAGKSLIATMLFYSNINFWMEAGYFDAPSQSKPLLHTWSLAVEEQFYIFFPLFMVLSHTYAQRYKKTAIMLLLLSSLILSIYQVHQDQTSAFYLTQFRIWELLTGSLLAVGVSQNTLTSTASNALGITGLLFTTAPMLLYTENTSFPGVSAIPPVIGTMLIMYSNGVRENLVGKILKQPVLVFFGKISYSLYLWHWPIFIFAKYYLIRPMNFSETSMILFLTIVISTISWKFIETPFRSREKLKTKTIFSLAAASTAIIVTIAGSMYYLDGTLLAAGITKSNGVERDNQWLSSLKKCDINTIDQPDDILTCPIGSKTSPKTFMVWGDSHAPTIFGKGGDNAAKENKTAGVITYSISCPPYLGITVDPPNGEIPCDQYNNMVIKYLERHLEIKTVILVSRATFYLEGTPYKQEEAVQINLVDNLDESHADSDSETLTRIGLTRTIQALQKLGRNVVIVTPIPEIGYDVPSVNFIATRTGRDANTLIAPTLEEYLARSSRIHALLNELEQEFGIVLIEPWKILCQDGICRVAIHQTPLYLDDDHLSSYGSEFLFGIFDPFFASIKNQ